MYPALVASTRPSCLRQRISEKIGNNSAAATERFAVIPISLYVRSNATSKLAVYPSLAGTTDNIDWRPPLSL